MLIIKSKKRIFHGAVLLGCIAFLNACSSFTEIKSDINEKLFGRDATEAAEPLTEIKQAFDIKVLWQAKVPAAENFEFSPVAEFGFVYAVGADGELVKLDETSGKQVWRVKVGEKISGGVGAGGSLVLVGTAQGVVYAYDLTGKLEWKSKLSSEILSVPKYYDGMVIVRTGDSKIYGINANDGTRKWVYDRTSPGLTMRSSAGVIVDGGAVYAGFAGGKLVAIRADNGKMLWETSVAQPKGVTEIERIADITSNPVVEGPLVYAVAYQGRIAAVDRLTGRVVWNRDISSLSGLAIQDARLFVTHTMGAVYSLDYATGKSFWRQAALKNRQLTAPVPMGSWIALGDLEGYVHFLNREDGSIDARIKIGSDPIMPRMMLINNNTLLAQSRDGGIYAIQIK